MRPVITAALLVIVGATLSGCATQKPVETGNPMGPAANRLDGYLTGEFVPDSKLIAPPPPAVGSAAQALDDELSRKYLAMAGSPRFTLASMDAVLEFPEAADTFTCALKAPITKEATPTLYKLLQRTLVDAGRTTAGAKSLYMRARPFTVNGRPTCSPASDNILRTNGSYPSGHSSAGWAWALVLAEVSPEHANEILARGRAFTESRLVCNVHWYSDTIEGTILGSAAVARMHAETAFQADVATARKELAAVRAKGAQPTRDCAAEAEALKN